MRDVHLIGVGGIGMRGLATLALARGYRVSGTDRVKSPAISDLVRQGMRWVEECEPIDLCPETQIVYSSAIPKTHPHFSGVEKKRCFHRSEFLSQLMNTKIALAVMGTHGKTTTSSILATIFLKSAKSCSYCLGGVLQSFTKTAEENRSAYFIAECDESDGSFVNYHPKGLILTNLDWDHPDYWENQEVLLQAFKLYLSSLSSCEFVWCYECPHLRSLLVNKGVSYGFDQGADIQIVSYSFDGMQSKFSLDGLAERTYEFILPLAGLHNILNATAAIVLAQRFGISIDEIQYALRTFQGVARRMELIWERDGLHFFDDYAHHPSEIKKSIEALRLSLGQDAFINVIFQPHRFSRLKQFYHEFLEAFKGVDRVYLVDVFAAGEPIEPIDYDKFSENLSQKSSCAVQYMGSVDTLYQFLLSKSLEGTWISMGAGDITNIGRRLHLMHLSGIQS